MPDIMLSMNDGQMDTISSSPQDAKGFATTDALTWSVDDGSVCSIMAAADGLSCAVSALKPGSCVVTATDGTLSQSVAITIVPAAPASLNLSTGAPQPEPVAVTAVTP